MGLVMEVTCSSNINPTDRLDDAGQAVALSLLLTMTKRPESVCLNMPEWGSGEQKTSRKQSPAGREIGTWRETCSTEPEQAPVETPEQKSFKVKQRTLLIRYYNMGQTA